MVCGDMEIDPLRHNCKWKGHDVRLTVTEFLILEALARRPGMVKNRDQLMDVAYDDQIYVDDRTIDSHIKRLRKKSRSEERRVGKEGVRTCRPRGPPSHKKKK